ncbi:MAG: SulP family inorganic anion transporter [Bacteriovoracia bacterium]
MKKYFAKETFAYDLKSGFTLFLIALPLSIGIAIASGAPASAGLLAAIVGGMLGSILGANELAINGPAAGLIIVILGAVDSMGAGNGSLGFRYTLASICAAGIIQIMMGIFRLASLGLAFPSAVIHGMLSAIGAIIIAKQIPVIFGVKVVTKSIFGLFIGIPQYISNLNPQVAFIGIASLVILFGLPLISHKLASKLPVPLIVVAFGIIVGKYFDLEHHHIVRFWNWKAEVGESSLLNVPVNIKGSILFPNFSMFFTFKNLVAVMSIAIIASIESVLSTFAVDKLDHQKRISDLNRDLASKGLCNTILGLIGGLPVITEIVRSSANISNGAKTRASNFLHGLFILIFLALFPELLHEIPLSALAAILMFVGWRLAHPSQFKHAYQVGPDHVLVFCITFLTTLATDLLVGVAVGVLSELVIGVYHGVQIKDLLGLNYKEINNEKLVELEIESSLVFVNSLKLRKLIESYLSSGQSLVVSIAKSRFVDHTVFDLLDRYKVAFREKKLDFRIDTGGLLQPLSKHPLASQRRKA